MRTASAVASSTSPPSSLTVAVSFVRIQTRSPTNMNANAFSAFAFMFVCELLQLYLARTIVATVSLVLHPFAYQRECECCFSIRIRVCMQASTVALGTYLWYSLAICY